MAARSLQRFAKQMLAAVVTLVFLVRGTALADALSCFAARDGQLPARLRGLCDAGKLLVLQIAQKETGGFNIKVFHYYFNLFGSYDWLNKIKFIHNGKPEI